jgi:hypothetical protein
MQHAQCPGLRSELMSTLRAHVAILIVAGSLVGCADLVAPNGGVAIIVQPDTVEANENLSPPSVQLSFMIQNTNTFMIAVSPCAPDVDREAAPDVWENVRLADECFLEPLPAGTHRFFVVFLGPIAPGRYRLRASYSVPDSRGVSATEKPTLSQSSNVFVVLPTGREVAVRGQLPPLFLSAMTSVPSAVADRPDSVAVPTSRDRGTTPGVRPEAGRFLP